MPRISAFVSVVINSLSTHYPRNTELSVKQHHFFLLGVKMITRLEDGRLKVGDFVLTEQELENFICYLQQNLETVGNPACFMTKLEVAEFLKISKTTVNKLMQEKKIPYYKIGDSVRFKKSEILESLIAVGTGA